MKIADFAFHCVQREAMAWLDYLAAAREAGIEGVSIGVGGVTLTRGMDATRLLSDAAATGRLLNELAEHEIDLVELNCTGNPLHPDPEIRSRHRKAIESSLELASQIGVRRVTTTSGCPGTGGGAPTWVVWPIFWDGFYERQWEETIACWTQLEAKARDRGVRICIELQPGMMVYNVATFERLLDATGEAIAVNLDPSHLFYQGMDPIAIAKHLGNRIGFVHAKDTTIDAAVVSLNGVLDPSPLEAPGRAWTYRAVGEGHPLEWWARFLGTVRSNGYDGPVCIEHEDPFVHGSEALQVNANALRAALAMPESA
ncbi:MAG: sugar phosphate isomerase/epimerase [Pirellulales bacterium]|nr:sugar phosphate isomerase/epimerase [Pirellulales bacterium]